MEERSRKSIELKRHGVLTVFEVYEWFNLDDI